MDLLSLSPIPVLNPVVLTLSRGIDLEVVHGNNAGFSGLLFAVFTEMIYIFLRQAA